ncbi:hypothetical protein HPB51_001675 [Rhipicephalus microplus]|uniref:Uncharacterized protein n=1 Tax=Rhipicephalus microplus TaxID=6941 RepID=A0A9J6EVX5_RHIMP|nr:hypothetical protein HPB51_001675 [Rhipicephalus microplus]
MTSPPHPCEEQQRRQAYARFCSVGGLGYAEPTGAAGGGYPSPDWLLRGESSPLFGEETSQGGETKRHSLVELWVPE